MTQFLLGATVMACFTISLIFLRFYVKVRDRFFLFFAAAFLVEAVDRIALELTRSSDASPLIYLLRLISFLLITYAIIDKNLLRRRPKD